MVVGSVGAIATGIAMPFFVVLWGNITNNYSSTDIVEEGKSTMF